MMSNKEMIKKYTKAITAARRLLEKQEEKMAEAAESQKKSSSSIASLISSPPPGLKKNSNGKYVLEYINPDYYNMVLIMRWIEFLFERVKRSKLTLVLDYYKDMGWISDVVKSQIMACARGEIQEASSYEEEITMRGATSRAEAPYDDPEGWRLSAEDHLKSLLFIEKIAGRCVSKDELNSLEQEIKAFKRSLEGFHGV